MRYVGSDEWDKYSIHARSHAEAARLAADLDLWLHCWVWVECDEEPSLHYR